MAKKRQTAREPEVPEPIRGEEIYKSKVHLFGLLVFCVFLAIICGVMLLDRVLFSEGEGLLPFRLTWWGILLCVIGLGIGVIGTIAFPIELMCPQRIVLGKESFQIVRKWFSGDTVELQIPYANIDIVEYEKVGEEWHLGIDLLDVGEENTYAKDPNVLQQQKAKGRDYSMDSGWTVKLEDLAKLLKSKVRKTRKARKAEEEDDEDDE